jgi:hypothetical protein
VIVTAKAAPAEAQASSVAASATVLRRRFRPGTVEHGATFPAVFAS